MIEWIIILLIIFCIMVAYYSQSVSEYSISQINESQIQLQLSHLWEERKPVVISDIREKGIWTAKSLKQTRFWGAQPVWAAYEAEPNTSVATVRAQHSTWADILGISTLESETLLKWFSISPWLFYTKTEAHIGYEGLRQCYGWATSFTCTDGEARCILIHSAQKTKLPPGWNGLRWSEATVTHHPLWTQVKFIEVILRPGTTLIVPPHWIVAIEPLLDEPIWWIRSDVHHPISGWAQQWNEKV